MGLCIFPLTARGSAFGPNTHIIYRYESDGTLTYYIDRYTEINNVSIFKWMCELYY